ncbi:hypothetical protein BDR22DRAFT_891034 [Usnea florida]
MDSLRARPQHRALLNGPHGNDSPLSSGSAHWTVGRTVLHNFSPARWKLTKLLLCNGTAAIPASISCMIFRDTGAGANYQQKPCPGQKYFNCSLLVRTFRSSVDIALTFDGRELRPEYLFGVFTNLAAMVSFSPLGTGLLRDDSFDHQSEGGVTISPIRSRMELRIWHFKVFTRVLSSRS